MKIFRKAKKAVEPRDEVKGFIARTYLYMTRAYRSEYQIWSDERDLMQEWNKKYPPDEWECRRAENIELVQGNRNKVVFGRCSDVKMSW